MERLIRELGPWERGVRFSAYGLLALAGVWLPFLAIGNVAHETAWVGVSLWMALGGLAAAWGTVTGRWVGEYVGLWPVITALIGFGALELAVFHTDGIPGTAMLWGFGLLATSRWMVVRRLVRSIDRAHSREAR